MMNKNLIVQRAGLVGFSKVLGCDQSSFILLARETDGTVGRRVYIDYKLAPKFASIVSREDKNGEARAEQALRALYKLRSTSAGISSYSNANNAFEHMQIFGLMKVTYKNVQGGGGSGLSGVYITDIDWANFGGGGPSIRLVSQDATGRDWSSKEVSSFTKKNIAINGLCQNPDDAACEIMPSMVEGAYGKAEGIDAIRREGFNLFYNPQCLYLNGSKWITPAQKRFNREYTAQFLGKQILNSKGKIEKIQWTIHGNGVLVFRDMLKQLVGGQSLNNHEAMLLSVPDEANVAEVLNLMRQAGIKPHRDVMKYHQDDWGGTKNITSRGASIARELEGFGDEYLSKSIEFKHRSHNNIKRAFSMLSSVYSGTVGLVLNYQSYRNMIAARLELVNPDINPHFHPYKDLSEFNSQADIKTASKVNRVFFSEVYKKLVGKR